MPPGRTNSSRADAVVSGRSPSPHVPRRGSDAVHRVVQAPPRRNANSSKIFVKLCSLFSCISSGDYGAPEEMPPPPPIAQRQQSDQGRLSPRLQRPLSPPRERPKPKPRTDIPISTSAYPVPIASLHFDNSLPEDDLGTPLSPVHPPVPTSPVPSIPKTEAQDGQQEEGMGMPPLPPPLNDLPPLPDTSLIEEDGNEEEGGLEEQEEEAEAEQEGGGGEEEGAHVYDLSSLPEMETDDLGAKFGFTPEDLDDDDDDNEPSEEPPLPPPKPRSFTEQGRMYGTNN